ncbi:hypothetical protein Poly51_44380 [Rubripirellula tenax]|uniref:Bacterial membrane protein YfhO n=1 Tax=Rubripirellula tenax TaxID=2528015 RepID=A0A5C6EI81_9BACT|nr:hypothetical protein [Rubripirellula tenax]TWU48538.1 hypothetical protein Poly51_44380 [Rubripirellula tenax]
MIRGFAVPITVALLLVGVLTGRERLAFRDVSHFYTPLYGYVADRCSQQTVPLWNPLDQTGIPLVGETTTAVFYPIRYFVFALPISTTVAMGWYVAIHLVVASMAASFAARAMGVRRHAAWCAAVMYPMSGSVWFLYTNPPYLVAAAWMPLALAALIGRARHGDRKPSSTIIISGFAMAMMVLGGDPQTALHVMMIAAAIIASRTFRRVPDREKRLATFATLVAAPLLAAALAAPQIAASVSWSRQSVRVNADVETSLVEAPIVGGKRHQAFQFSLPPWHIVEVFTPNAFGSLLPAYRRLSHCIPGDGRMWTPTVYAGMLAALVWLDRLIRIRRERMDAPMAIAIAALVLATGHFGCVWWLQATTGMLGNIDSSVGGPYWCLYQFFPGYDSFRYPAKWLTFFSLGTAVMSARWLDQSRWTNARRPIILVTIIIAGAAIVVTSMKWNGTGLSDADSLPADRFWGPLDFAGGLTEITGSLVHSAVTLSMIIGIVLLGRAKHWKHTTWVTVVVGITLIELMFVDHSITYVVNRADEDRRVASIAADPSPVGNRWMRTQSGGGWPTQWQESTDNERLIDVEASQRASWFGRWHLADQQAVFNNMVSIDSRAMDTFWKNARATTSTKNESERADFWTDQQHRYSIDGVIHCTDRASNGMVDVVFKNRPAETVTAKNDYHIDSPTTSEIIRPVFQDGNWVAEFRATGNENWKSAVVVPHDELKQATSIPAGRWHVRFRYRPWWITPTIGMAATAWTLVIGCAGLAFRQRRHTVSK